MERPVQKKGADRSRRPSAKPIKKPRRLGTGASGIRTGQWRWGAPGGPVLIR